MYDEDNLLMISGMQHYAYCTRQWALIHVEQQWQSNHLTLEGDFLHERTDDPELITRGRGVITLRSVPLVNYTLGIYGILDAMELRPTEVTENSISHPKFEGYFKPFVIEYKHGKPKVSNIDKVQLCAQVQCLEEMYDISIGEAALYYAKIRHHEKVVIDNTLREETKALSAQMHELLNRGITPRAEKSLKCRNCSLQEICMPKIEKRVPSLSNYIKELYDAETT